MKCRRRVSIKRGTHVRRNDVYLHYAFIKRFNEREAIVLNRNKERDEHEYNRGTTFSKQTKTKRKIRGKKKRQTLLHKVGIRLRMNTEKE